MKKILCVFLCLLLVITTVSAQVEFFPFYKEEVWLGYAVMDQLTPVVTLTKKTPLVEITDHGFIPSEVVISVGDEVLWKNVRGSVFSLVYGVREISAMRSSLIRVGDEFSWTFDTSGEFTYIDAVVIGRIGTIIVK